MQTLTSDILSVPLPTFSIIGDPGNHLYRLYGLEKSWGRLVTTFVTSRNALATIREGYYAIFVKGFWPGKIDAGIHRIPADFLIWPDQVVKKAYSGKYPGDHLPYAEIDQSVASARRQTSRPCVTFSPNAHP